MGYVSKLFSIFRQDLLYSFRSLAKHRSFSLAVISVLTITVAANTTIFSLIDALLLRSLPLYQPSRLFQIEMLNRRGEKRPLSYPMFQSIRDRQSVFESIAAWKRPHTHDAREWRN